MWYNYGMNSICVRAFAKINLTLDITGARGGYHAIDSVVASIDVFDEIELKRREDGLFSVHMSGQGSEAIPPQSNNALRAAEAFGRQYKTQGADIFIRKNIPVGAGLGGSSADVAGVLNALSAMYGAEYDVIKRIADDIGSDCGYMLRGGFARITGRGERVCPVECGKTFYLLLAVPEGGVPTGRCYALSDVYPEKRHTSNAVYSAICAGQFEKVGGSLSNGLYPAAAVINPAVREASDAFSALCADGVNMTGSGSGVYALFSERDARDGALARYGGAFKLTKAQTIIPPRYI